VRGTHPPAVVSAFQDTGIQQGMHVTVDRLHIATDAPGNLAYRHRALPGSLS
jgi:hypothetical protein